MSGTAELETLYSAIEQSARLLDIPCSRGKVWPILSTYGDSLGQSVIAFRVATGARGAGELDCRFMLPNDGDPYALALSRGLTAATDHPSGALPADLRERFPIDRYAVDFGVVSGFTKTWSFFPADAMQRLSKLAEVPSMPPSLAGNVDFFARHDLEDKGSLIGIDHQHNTVNVYFGTPPAACFEPQSILAMHREIGLPDPSDEMLRFGQGAFGIYVTLSWDSPRVERICFAVMTPDPSTLPVRIEPRMEHFIRNAPTDGDDRRFVYAITSSPAGEYHKLQSYYRWRQQMLDVMLLSDSVDAG